MVQLTSTLNNSSKHFGNFLKKSMKYNHRKPIKFQRFQSGIDQEEIVAHYSRDDIDSIDRRAGERTYKDATLFMGRKNLILPNLSPKDLAINEMFQREHDRQRAIVSRVEKIRVLVDSVPGKGAELIMNKDISTPFDCARHLHDMLTTRTVVAEISPLESDVVAQQNEDAPGSTDQESAADVISSKNRLAPQSTYWDMHNPLTGDCRIKFRHFTESDVGEVNKIYWRSCSFILGMAIRMAFKDGVKVILHSWPKPNIKSGSFVYDAAINLSDTWKPSEQELRAFTKIMWNIKGSALPFDRLQVDRDFACKLFDDNPFKLAQIDSILSKESNQGKITVYRCGGLVDISIGPMISNTCQIGRITLTSVHPFELKSEQHKGVFYRFQGVSLPQELPVSSYLYQNVLINNAKKLNQVAM